MRAALALVIVMVALPAAALADAPDGGQRAWSPARSSPCDRPHTGPLVYHWPVKPFDRQHPIRGFFGDPRTVALGESELGDSTPLTPGSYTFHNGIDIAAATGTAVYPVVSGRAGIGYGDEVIVVTGDGRTFQYFHIRPAIARGQQVVADKTIIGYVLPGWLHVHLSEIDGFRVHNPLDPGHLEPYVDHTVPVVHRVEVTAPTGAGLEDERPARARALRGGRVRHAAARGSRPLVRLSRHARGGRVEAEAGARPRRRSRGEPPSTSAGRSRRTATSGRRTHPGRTRTSPSSDTATSGIAQGGTSSS